MRNAIKVLIVDDDKSSSQMLSEVVKRMGFKPVLASKPVDALNVVRLQSVHAAIVDVLLPKMSGVDLVAEFRNTQFAENPVVLVSGVFKDKTFSAEALKKTKAADFLFKPFGAEELQESLQKALAPILHAERWSVQSLLTRKFSSDRDRARAIEKLEQIQGLDFPYVLGFLMEANTSGALNIVNESGEIFGVTISGDAVTEIDSADSLATGILALINNGFLAQEDWDEFQAKHPKKIPIERLVQEGLVSPHAVSVAKREQIFADFKSICGAKEIQLNFIPQEDDSDSLKASVRMGELLTVFLFNIQEFFPREYLEGFYEPVKNSPIRVLEHGDEVEAIWKLELFRPIEEAKEIVMNGGSLLDMVDRFPDDADRVYQAIHLLVLNGWLIFEDVNLFKAQAALLERYRKLHAELSPRSPSEIMEYFGAAPNASRAVLDGIRDEFLRSNPMDASIKEANPELFDIWQKVIDIVQEAHDVLTDETKREKYMEEQKVRTAEALRVSNRLTAEGLDLLRKGKFQDGLAKLKEAESTHPTTLQFLIQVWAEIKCGGGANKSRVMDMFKRLEMIPAEDRKSAYYFMALGLVKKSLGDATATNYFEKALQIDSHFVEARRELNSMGGPPKKEKLDIFHGDITQVVSQLFRRKAD